VPIDFILFGLTLAGVAVFHHHTLAVALTGLIVIVFYQLLIGEFPPGPGFTGLVTHLQHEWVIIANLALLLLGFAILSRHFEKSHVPLALPRLLPDDWKGCFALLVIVFVLSSFLDNIAAALIGGAMAHTLFKKVHLGYLAAVVAASNAGGSGSVVGDTTTTMMWIDGVDPRDVFHAYAAAVVALVISGLVAAFQQHAHSPIMRTTQHKPKIDWVRVGIVVAMLLAAIVANVVINIRYPALADVFPFIGTAVWVMILLSAPIRRPDWELLREAGKGALFLLSLVLAASMMPVDQLPAASWQTAFGLGFVSAVFDNIPLTKLALEQGGYDWGVLAYAVGYGGSMIWFGSSAGVAITNLFPEARSVGAWLKNGWHVAVAYVIGFFAMLMLVGWEPHEPHKAYGAAAAEFSSTDAGGPSGRGLRWNLRSGCSERDHQSRIQPGNSEHDLQQHIHDGVRL
jgi:Na+/H+ antiporter NhaD/arsenite permease-like protein